MTDMNDVPNEATGIKAQALITQIFLNQSTNIQNIALLFGQK